MTKTATVVIDTKDKNGVQLESRMRVTTKEGLKAHVTRIDVKSGRAVVIFDEVDGVVPIQPTMRRCNTLAVRKNAGKILFVKEAVKAAKAKENIMDKNQVLLYSRGDKVLVAVGVDYDIAFVEIVAKLVDVDTESLMLEALYDTV